MSAASGASDSRARSVSHEVEESEGESNAAAPAGKPGRKKNPNSQAARRDQNRIAQREFRLRKQQRIRDLEARVEILSGGKDDAVYELRMILRDMMEENQALRGLLKGLSAFIGEGAGGTIAKLGWDMNDFNNFVNKSSSDTAYENYQKRKTTGKGADASGSGAGGTAAIKRRTDDLNGGPSKRSRGSLDQASEHDHSHSYTPILQMTSPTAPSPESYAGGGGRSTHDSLFSELMRGTGASTMFMTPSTHAPQQSPAAPFTVPPPPAPVGMQGGGYQVPYMSSMGLSVESPSTSVSFSSPPTRGVPPPPPPPVEEDPDEEEDPKTQEAQKLIAYHLDNWTRNRQYHLPSSLRPTLVQQTVPHESIIDGIPLPDLRDRIILLRGRFDLVDCLHDLQKTIKIHGDDVLAPANWEIGENWLRRYGFLVDQSILDMSNRWRKNRGDVELRLTDISSSSADNSK